LWRQGLGATNHFEGGGFARSNEDVTYPNLMFHFLPIAVRYDGSAPVAGHGYQIHVGPMYSDARGSVKVRSTDPAVHPAIPSTTSRPPRTVVSGWRQCASVVAS
jgi:choline dehydrogenase